MILNLQLLRAFAALNVVLFHIIGTATSYGYETNLISSLEGWGANGVDIFFVISGFVMLYTQLDGKKTVKDFLILRAIRIVPIYWLLTLTLTAIYVVAPFVFREMIISTEWLLASLGFMSNALGEAYPIVFVGWTLEWEMLFYLVFGLSLWFRSWVVTLSVTFTALIGIAFATSNFILLEFLAGLLIALFFKRYGFNRFGYVSLILGGLLLSLSISEEVRALIDSRVILWGLPSVLIVYGVIAIPQASSRLGKLLGDASYSIYLIQVLSLPVFYKIIHFSNIQLNNDLLAICCLIATAIFGTAIYLTIEKPMTQMIKKRVYAN
ncbi:acyltransferase [Octadecabacter sp.]|nr:acyltransferase [Octadecabacter sp.]